MRFITTLTLRDCHLTTGALSPLRGLHNLHTLSVIHCDDRDDEEAAALKGLGGLTSLRELRLVNVFADGPFYVSGGAQCVRQRYACLTVRMSAGVHSLVKNARAGRLGMCCMAPFNYAQPSMPPFLAVRHLLLCARAPLA